MKNINSKTGKTLRQENLEKEHMVPVGTFVKLKDGQYGIVRKHQRDCDGTPLYSIEVTCSGLSESDFYVPNLGE